PSAGHVSPTPAWQLHGTQVQVLEPYTYADLWALEQIAVLQDLGPPRTYLLDPQHATRQGMSPAAALTLLEQMTGEALPQPLIHLFAPFPSILVQRGVLVAFSSPDHLAALQRGRSWRNRF